VTVTQGLAAKTPIDHIAYSHRTVFGRYQRFGWQTDRVGVPVPNELLWLQLRPAALAENTQIAPRFLGRDFG